MAQLGSLPTPTDTVDRLIRLKNVHPGSNCESRIRIEVEVQKL